MDGAKIINDFSLMYSLLIFKDGKKQKIKITKVDYSRKKFVELLIYKRALGSNKTKAVDVE